MNRCERGRSVCGARERTSTPGRNDEGPAGERGLRSSHGRWGERGHQVCAEPSAALGSEGSSRTTGKLKAWERGEIRCGVMAWEVIVSFPSRWWRHQELSHVARAAFRRLAGV